MMRVQLDSVSRVYRSPDGSQVRALQDVSLSAKDGEMIMVVGPNGAGKSTLLEVLSGDIKPEGGRVILHGPSAQGISSRALGSTRRPRAAWVRQDPSAGVVTEFSLAENLRLASLRDRPSSWRPALTGSVLKDARRALSQTALSLVRPGRKADELSFGQRQLLALEMASRQAAELLLLDEPTAALDQSNALLCMGRTRQLVDALQAVAFVVTHDMALAAQFGDRLVVLRDGRIHEDLTGPAKLRLTAADVFSLCGFDKFHQDGHQ